MRGRGHGKEEKGQGGRKAARGAEKAEQQRKLRGGAENGVERCKEGREGKGAFRNEASDTPLK